MTDFFSEVKERNYVEIKRQLSYQKERMHVYLKRHRDFIAEGLVKPILLGNEDEVTRAANVAGMDISRN